MRSAGHRLRVGRADVLIVKDGSAWAGPVSRYMIDVPAKIASRTMTMLGGFALVDHRGTRVLIDTGNGAEAPGRTHDPRPVLAAAGIGPETVQTVLLTHGDPDHIGGLLRPDGSLAYPNALVVLHEDLWAAWRELGTRGWQPAQAGTRFACRAPFVARLAELLDGRCRLITREEPVAPGLRAIPSPGHRVGHVAYLLESLGERVLHIGDAAFDPVFLECEESLCSSDTDPEEARASRQMLVARAIADEARIIGSHFLAGNVGRIIRKDGWNVWRPADAEPQTEPRRNP